MPALLDELPISLDAFIQRVGITDVTAWRWRRDGKLKTSNIAGRVYIMPEDAREFTRRVKAGEFAQTHKAPRREKVLVE
jgi:predicted site-specific integrase-resolvase